VKAVTELFKCSNEAIYEPTVAQNFRAVLRKWHFQHRNKIHVFES